MIQEQEQRHIYYDQDLKIEAYNLSGIVQKFPNHFLNITWLGLWREESAASGAGVRNMI